jgi:hypothetical protein
MGHSVEAAERESGPWAGRSEGKNWGRIWVDRSSTSRAVSALPRPRELRAEIDAADLSEGIGECGDGRARLRDD